MRSLYASPAKPAAKPASKPRAPIFAGSGEGGTISLSLSNYYDRKIAIAAGRNDPEQVQHMRAEQNALQSFCQRKGLNADDVHTVLTVLREYETNPRPAPKTDEERTTAAQATLEALRKAVGSEPAALRTWERAAEGAKVVNQEIPSIAARAQSTGATSDPRILQLLAAVAPPKEAA